MRQAPELVSRFDLSMTLGECATWDERRARFLWTDIETSRLFILDWESGDISVQDLPHRLASFGLTENPDVLLAAFDFGLAWFNIDTWHIDVIHRLYDPSDGIRLNDGRMDRQGRFWVGSMAEPVVTGQYGRGQLYCYDGTGEPSVHRKGIVIPNSLAWSPDGSRLYFCDSKAYQIDYYDFDTQSGALSNKAAFATLPPGIHADGSCIDTDGCLWNAQWGGGQVVQYRADGTVAQRINLPTLEPTCVTLGGPELDHLLVVTASLGGHNGDRPSDGNGSTYLFKTSSTGLIEPKFRITPP